MYFSDLSKKIIVSSRGRAAYYFLNASKAASLLMPIVRSV
jgi:hypothetical protein